VAEAFVFYKQQLLGLAEVGDVPLPVAAASIEPGPSLGPAPPGDEHVLQGVA